MWLQRGLRVLAPSNLALQALHAAASDFLVNEALAFNSLHATGCASAERPTDPVLASRYVNNPTNPLLTSSVDDGKSTNQSSELWVQLEYEYADGAPR